MDERDTIPQVDAAGDEAEYPDYPTWEEVDEMHAQVMASLDEIAGLLHEGFERTGDASSSSLALTDSQFDEMQSMGAAQLQATVLVAALTAVVMGLLVSLVVTTHWRMRG